MSENTEVNRLRMTADHDHVATIADLNISSNRTVVISTVVNMYMAVAIVGALDQAGVLSPLDVAKWAEFFAEAQSTIGPYECRDEVRSALANFAEVIRPFTVKPGSTDGNRH